jgi:hypothetical protein
LILNYTLIILHDYWLLRPIRLLLCFRIEENILNKWVIKKGSIFPWFILRCCMRLWGCELDVLEFTPSSLLLQQDHVWIFKVEYILFNWNGRIAIGLEINSEVYMCWELVKLCLKQSGAKQSLCWMLELRYDITWWKRFVKHQERGRRKFWSKLSTGMS